ncbi:MAG: energy transducer TonB, partial [Candidatus Dadabacteria bacterium]
VVIKLKSKGEIQSTKENNKPNVTINDKSNSPKPMYMVDGKENADALETLKPEGIQSVNVLKGDAAEKKYGDKGKNGVIEITTKKAGAPVTDGTTTIPGVTHNDPDVNRIFEKTETPASIDLTEWRKFLSENLQPVIESVAGNGARPGSYTTQVKFIVETDGTLSNASIVKDPGYNLGKKVMEFIYKSPKWEPATQNGIKVRSYHTQPITFVISKQ